MKYLYIIATVIFLTLPVAIYAQGTVSGKFDNNLQANKKYSFQKVKALSKSQNAYNFMALGYFVNANNIMYEKTSDVQYLENNFELIKPILLESSGNNYTSNNWRMRVGKGNRNFASNGKENVISEGYFFRYIGEFLDIIVEENLFTNEHSAILNGMQHSYQKWRAESYRRYGDYSSLLYHLRLHTGANWATVALYLRKYDSANRGMYSEFLNKFDKQLNKALQLKEVNGRKYLVWNSTYPDKFSALLKTVKNYKPIIQDVSHGNHVVQYLIKAKELNNKNWMSFNFDHLINTLDLKILNKGSVSDNVDGSTSMSVKDTGWKQTDGWMKLIQFRPSLREKYMSFYSIPSQKNRIENSMLGLQFFANLEQ